MSDYVIGLLTFPAAAAMFVALYATCVLLYRALRRWWLAPHEFGPEDWTTRARHAACVFAARRMWGIKLPGSRLLIFRSTVGGVDYELGTYYGDTTQLQRAARDTLLDEFDPR